MRETIKDFVSCLESLKIAINDAGGNAPSLTALKDMKALDLIDLISTNSIEFLHIDDGINGEARLTHSEKDKSISSNEVNINFKGSPPTQAEMIKAIKKAVNEMDNL